jgi:ribose 5-phosphate isomerase A
MNAEDQKRAAAARALEFVMPGMRLGLGTGSTARHFVDLLGERVRGGFDVVGVPTSEATRTQAESVGIRLTTLDETPELDLTVDGADEVGPDLSLIKGGGGALLREKIGRFPLPVEVLPFGFGATRRAVERLLARENPQGKAVLRAGRDGHAFVTDGGHWIIDASFGRIADPARLAHDLAGIPGVMEHGLFVGLAQVVILAGAAGIRVIERPARTAAE